MACLGLAFDYSSANDLSKTDQHYTPNRRSPPNRIHFLSPTISRCENHTAIANGVQINRVPGLSSGGS